RLDRGELLLGEVLAALAFLELQALAACLEASPGALRALLFRRQLEDACLCLAEIRDERNVAGTDEVAAAAFDAVPQPQLAKPLVVVGDRVPVELLRLEHDGTDDRALAAANTRGRTSTRMKSSHVKI